MPIWLTSRLCRPIWQLWADLHQVVDLGALADARGLEGAAVDGGAGADLDVVADLDVAQLRHLDVPAVLEAVAEAVGADHGVGVDDDAVAEDGAVVEHGVGIQSHVVAEPAVAADDRAGVNAAAGAQDAAFADRRRTGSMLGASPTTARRMDGRARSMPCGGGSATPCRWRTMATKAASGSADLDDGMPLARHRRRHHDRGGPADVAAGQRVCRLRGR